MSGEKLGDRMPVKMTSDKTITPILSIFATILCLGCSEGDSTTIISSNDEPSVTLTPGATLTIGTTSGIGSSGTYNIPQGASRIRWTCTGTVTVDIQSQSGSSSQQCSNGSQSVSVTGPGTMAVQFGNSGTLVVTATGS